MLITDYNHDETELESFTFSPSINVLLPNRVSSFASSSSGPPLPPVLFPSVHRIITLAIT